MNVSTLGKTYTDGEIIVRQGESGNCMFTVQKGQVEVLKEHEGRGQVRVATLGKGDIFGEMAIFEREVRSATVRALGEAQVLTVDKKTFLRRVQEDPSLAFNLVRLMSQRIRNLTAELGERRSKSDRRKLKDRRQFKDRRLNK